MILDLFIAPFLIERKEEYIFRKSLYASWDVMKS